MPALSLDRLQHVRSRLRSVLTWRTAVLLIMVVIVFAGGQRLLGTLFVSAGMVREQIHEAVRGQTGLDFLVKGETSISFWPSPVITLKDVEVVRPEAMGDKPVFRADSVSGRFDVVSALTGSPQFSSLTVTRPVFRLVRSAAGTFVWQRSPGAKSKGPASLDVLRFGHVKLVDGEIEFRQEGGLEAAFKNVGGALDFSTLSRSLSFDLTASASDRPLALSGSVQSPEKLLAGDNSDLSLKLVSDDIDISFAGTANVGDQSFLSGVIDASASDIGAAAKWVGLRYAVLDNLKVVDLKASIASEGMKFTLSDLKLQLPAYQATGIVSAGWTKRGEPPFFSGTLAFDNFDAGAFLTAFVPAAADLRGMPLTFDTAFLRDFEVDLRVSANKVAFGQVALSDMAAGIRVTKGRASFAIASAQVANGNVSAELSVDDDREKGPLCKLTAQARGVDLGTVPAMLGLSGPWPQASGSLEIDLRSRLPLSVAGQAETNGSIKVHGGAGKLTGFDPAVFRELASQKRFFDLSLASANPLRFDSFEMAAVVDNGIAELNTANFKSTSGDLTLAGVIPYKNSSIAVSGTLGPAAGVNATPTRFFAGGAWPNILISPFSAVMSDK